MEAFVLDTNLFFNMEAGFALGEKTEDVVKHITQMARQAKKNQSASFYMPPRIVEEFLGFFEDKEQPFLKEFLAEIHVKSPNAGDLSLSSTILYQFVEEARHRAYRGLTVAEEEIQKAGQMMQGTGELSKKDFQIKIGTVVKHFRDRFRTATRVGFLDSVADLDLIMLAKELDAHLITSDEGVNKWGRVIGVKEMAPTVFGQKLKSLIAQV